MSIEIKLLNEGDADVLENVEQGTFDDPIDARGTLKFLNDPRHHLAVAISDDKIVGFVSAVHYAHPDKRYPEMWINEVQVAPPHRRQGLAKALVNRMLQLGRDLECTEAWVITGQDNSPAASLYSALGGEVSSPSLMYSFPLEKSQLKVAKSAD